MTLDRADSGAIVFAVAAHAGLVVLLALAMARAPGERAPPEAPTIEVSFADEAALVSSGETTEPSAQSIAPELGEPEEAAPAEPDPAPPVPEPTPAPVPQPSPPQPQPKAQPQPRPTPQPRAQPRPQPRQTPPRAQPRPQPPANTRTPPRPNPRPSPPRNSGNGNAQANRARGLGPDLLKGIGNDPVSRNPRSSGATMSTQAAADIGSLITRQVQPCASRQRSPGPGAEQIRVTVRLTINRDGTLGAEPRITAREGVNESNRRYLPRVEEITIAAFRNCSPLRGLPAELYDVPRGWRNFALRFRLPG